MPGTRATTSRLDVRHLRGAIFGAILGAEPGAIMPAIKVSEDLRPLTDLKLGAGEIVGQLERTGRPVVLTRHGRGVAVMLSLAAFEEIQERLAQADLRAALEAGERDVREGRTIAHADMVAKYLGQARG